MTIRLRILHQKDKVNDYCALGGYAAQVWPTRCSRHGPGAAGADGRGYRRAVRAGAIGVPAPVEGIEKYLGSGTIRGIGPVYTRKLVRAFGGRVFAVIEAEPERLREVTGIGKVRAKRITDAWAEQKVVREIMVFLHVATASGRRGRCGYSGPTVPTPSR